MYLLLRLMGCVVWTTAIVLTFVFIAKTVRAFREDESAGMKVGGILATIANVIIGTGLGLLFYQVAALIK